MKTKVRKNREQMRAENRENMWFPDTLGETRFLEFFFNLQQQLKIYMKNEMKLKFGKN